MPRALIISSHVAASYVGGSAQAMALAHFRFDSMVVPTVLYGRHPGWGAPGGAAVPVEAVEGMLDGIEANGLFGQTDLVLTGYFASAAQVLAAARAIDAVRAAPRSGESVRKPIVIVDPTMGDTGKGLYVPQDVADAIVSELVSRADIVALQEVDHNAKRTGGVDQAAELGRLRPGRERAAGYREAHKALGLKVDERLVRGFSNQIHTSYDEMSQLLRLKDRPTAIIALGNRILSGALRAMHEAGLTMGQDMSVVTIGSDSVNEFAFPPATLIRFDVEAFGKVAAEVLLERLRHPELPPRQVTLPTQLVVGASCGPRPRTGAKSG